MNSGIKNFLLVSLALKELGYQSLGIRLDSGDLAQLSKDCKKLIHEIAKKFGYEEDFKKIQIVASNDINE